MPNHVMNTISAPGIGKLPILSLENGEEKFDFGKLVPMPEEVKIQFECPEPEPFGKTDGWYNWCCNYWGTKWNAYRCHIDEDEISFLSAWNAPKPVIRALAARYPEKEFVHSYLVEGFMETIYIDIYEHGVLVESREISNPYYWTYCEDLEAGIV